MRADPRFAPDPLKWFARKPIYLGTGKPGGKAADASLANPRPSAYTG
jgi:hypothetical protein